MYVCLLARPCRFDFTFAGASIAIDVVSVVALFIEGADTVSTGCVAATDFADEVAQAETVVRARWVALGLEDHNLVDFSSFESEVDGPAAVSAGVAAGPSGSVGGVERDTSGDGVVNSAEVYGEGFVDEDPDVVVATEGEVFSASVFKPVSDFGGETEVTITLVRGVSEAESV